jgi:beta-galactosidase
LDDLLAAGASVNFSMFHGGTNFDLTNGANDKHGFEPTITTPDYDAPLEEAGYPTPKHTAFGEVIAKYATVPTEPVPVASAKLTITGIELSVWAALFHQAGQFGADLTSAAPLTMEGLAHAFGFIRYRSTLHAPAPACCGSTDSPTGAEI